MLRASSLLVLVLASGSMASCDSDTTADSTPDGAAHVDVDLDSAAEGGDDADGAGPNVSGGPISLVLVEAEVTPDRVCDLDGDGFPDNALADLGDRDSALMAAALSTFLQERVRTFLSGLVFHMPWVEDASGLTDPEVPLSMATGIHLDTAGDPDTGGSLWVAPSSLDGCGEPMNLFSSASLQDGTIAAAGGTLVFGDEETNFRLEGVSLTGEVDAGGLSAETDACGRLPIEELGDVPIHRDGEISALEAFLLGGQAFGLPFGAGATPDVDVDGDGLETFVLSPDGNIESCIDGDYTVIAGQDCWRDPRMADAFGTNVTLRWDAARLVGLLPSWPWETAGSCGSSPPSPDFWAEGEGSLCERWVERGCEPPCGGDGTERCTLVGDSWEPCLPTGVETFVATSCEDFDLGEGVVCSGDSPTLLPAGARDQARTVTLRNELLAPRGPMIVRARARVSRGAGPRPGEGWRIDLAVGETGLGLSLTWHFDNGPEVGTDRVVLRHVEGSEDESIEAHSGPEVQPSLDADTVGAVEQELQLFIQPDLPETESNEMIVSAGHVTDGVVYVYDMRCLGDGCPVVVQAGDPLRVGMTAYSWLNDAVIEIPELSTGPLSVELHGACP